MATISVDTKRLETDGNRILELSRQYNNLINDYFDQFDRVIVRSWSGNASNKYRSNLMNERLFFEKLTPYIKAYGDELINHADQLNNSIRKCENN